MKNREQTPEDLQETLQDQFKAQYGIDPGTAAVLFANSTGLKTLLAHMYNETMDELRECDIARDGQRIQGQAQLLYSLYHIPDEVEAIQHANDSD